MLATKLSRPTLKLPMVEQNGAHTAPIPHPANTQEEVSVVSNRAATIKQRMYAGQTLLRAENVGRELESLKRAYFKLHDNEITTTSKLSPVTDAIGEYIRVLETGLEQLQKAIEKFDPAL